MDGMLSQEEIEALLNGGGEEQAQPTGDDLLADEIGRAHV